MDTWRIYGRTPLHPLQGQIKNITVIGASNMGSAFVKQLTRAGHQVNVIARDSSKAARVAAANPGARAVSAAGAAALAFAFTKLIAIFAVHFGKGFFMDKGGYEYALALFAASLSLLFSGAGRFSVDRTITGER